MKKVICMEIKKDIKSNQLLMALLVSFAFGFIWMIRSPSAFLINDYMYEYFRGFFYVVVFFSGLIFAKEVENGVIRYQFGSVYPRVKIFLAKMIALSVYSLMFWAVSSLYAVMLGMICEIDVRMGDIFSISRLLLYFGTMFVVSGFNYMLSVSVKKRLIVLVIALVFWGIPYHILPFFMYSSFTQGMFDTRTISVIKLFPQGTIITCLSENAVILPNYIIMVVIGCIFFGISYLKYSRMEYR